MQRPSFAIYDASAGSGKTYALVKEYLKIILNSPKHDAFRNILAITFTNKAVHEMKSRIVDSLSEFAKEDPNEKAKVLLQDLVHETRLSENQIKLKSQQIIKHIIHNYAAFDISTIDKFTHKVIRTFAHDLGLSMTFDVNLDTENLLIEAVDAIIAQAGEDEILTKLLVDFTIEKTNDDKSWDISNEIYETGKLVLNENNRNEIIHFQNKSIEEFIKIKDKLNNTCKDLLDETVELATQALALIEESGIDTKSFSSGHFPNHLKSIVEGRFNPSNKKYHKTDDIKINKTAKDTDLIKRILPELLLILNKIYKIFEKHDFYKAFLKNITPLSLLNTISNELMKIQKEQNILSITEFNSIIHKEIQNQPAPFIYERLGEKYHHFFIDEFQDTSEMQWNNLIPLINNATSSEFDGEKGTLMIVGDPKQSIYRWRGGKAEQFIALSKAENPFNNPEKELIHLDKNYRSYSEIIAFNNDFFKMLSNEFTNENYKDLYANHSKQKMNDKIGGYVNISFISDETLVEDDEENIQISDKYLKATLKTIRKIIDSGFELRDIVILTRKRIQGIAIANYLTEQAIPLVSSETLLIKNATEVQMIINVLKYLKNSNDLEAKAHFLQYIAAHSQTEFPIHDFIARGMQENNEKAFELWLVQYCTNDSEGFSFKNLRNKTLYEIVEIIIAKFIKPKSNNAYVQYFLDIVLENSVKNRAGIIDFLNYWGKSSEKLSIPSPEGKDAVRIMTIHQSKGLEFPVVIMPFADEDYSRKPKDKLWLDAEEATMGLPKVLIDNSKAIEGFGEEAALLFNQKKQEELLDNINVLYVALTRAEEQLYIISNMNLSTNGEVKTNTMSSFFINYLSQKNVFEINKSEYEFGNNKKISSAKRKTESVKSIDLLDTVLNPVNIKIAQKDALMWGTSQQKAIEYGNLMHEILSFIKNKNEIDIAITKAIEMGLINLSQKDLVYNTIHEIVNHKELECFFEEGNEVLNEKTIIQKEGPMIKPDRMIITKDNKVYLLDYKTGTEQSKYKLQLENYQKAIEDIGYNVTKKSIIYIGEQINIVNL